jgi:hypothetical protein
VVSPFHISLAAVTQNPDNVARKNGKVILRQLPAPAWVSFCLDAVLQVSLFLLLGGGGGGGYQAHRGDGYSHVVLQDGFAGCKIPLAFAFASFYGATIVLG